ncbi:MAG: tRNA pseudouridine(55) synthase TruB [Candidatus Omnitrophica bacterium]|nr:tRNA pseudouridine(55) synthase TruB [Candidatus Omnitrophota bacterium]
MQEILFVDKPKGMSSFSVIRALRKKLKIRKMGHAGTLDPIATGLLIIGVGNGTKRLAEYFNLPKVYLIDILLGKQTDTGDITGAVTGQQEVKSISEEEVRSVLKSLEGVVEMPIPLYSAVKHKGMPFYKYARKRIKVEPRLRKSEIFYLDLLETKEGPDGPVITVEMKCQKGTYARSVAEEIGKRLGTLATVFDLRRLQVGDISVSQAKRLDEF